MGWILFINIFIKPVCIYRNDCVTLFQQYGIATPPPRKEPTAMNNATTSINPLFVKGFVVARDIENPGQPIIGNNKCGKYAGLSALEFAKAMKDGGTCWTFRLEEI